MSSHQKLRELLADLELAMQQAGLHASSAPSAQALSSQLPFCCDTLSFEQWLQFVFIPRMQVIIERGLPLPVNSAILPMAEEMLGSLAVSGQILAVIGSIDAVLNQGHHPVRNI